MLYLTAHRFEELRANFGTGQIIFNQQNARFPRSPHRLPVLVRTRNLGSLRHLRFRYDTSARIIGHSVGDLMNVIRVERIYADSLADRIDGITRDVVHGVTVDKGHRARCDNCVRISGGTVHILETLELAIGDSLSGNA